MNWITLKTDGVELLEIGQYGTLHLVKLTIIASGRFSLIEITEEQYDKSVADAVVGV